MVPIRVSLLFFILVLAACSSSDGESPIPTPPPQPQPSGVRTAATFSELTNSSFAPNSPIHNNFFLPLGTSGEALQELAGVLSVDEQSFSRTGAPPIAARRFPGFEVEFFTHDGFLVPTVRQILQPQGTSYWTILLSPGRVWSEPEDMGMSRASFPFVLADNYENAAHNGLATFLFDNTTVSQLRIQIVQESAAWDQFDGWDQFPMNYTPRASDTYDALRTRFIAERASRFPTAPWSELETLAGTSLTAIRAQISPEQITYQGMVVDDVLYLPEFETRYGPFPFPEYMRAGAFSVTKSMGAALTMFRLAQKYGPRVFDLFIKDYLNVTATHNGWESVTFGDCLNMATGIGDNSANPNIVDMLADENGTKMGRWQNELSRIGKLNVSFDYNNYPWEPGQIVRYNTTHTFVLGAAMDAFYKSMEGDDAHIWDMMQREVYEPIGIYEAPMAHTREPDGSQGVPLYGVGLYPTAHDLARVIRLFENSGRSGQEQLISWDHAQSALFRGNNGLSIGSSTRAGDPYLYHYGFWSEPYRGAGGCLIQLPYMSGFGGNMLVVGPNGVSGFRFSDTHNYDVLGIAQDMERVRSFTCP